MSDTTEPTGGRFVRLPHWVIDDTPLNIHELVLYAVLLRYRDPQTNQCWPGQSELAAACRMSTTKVKEATASLEQYGFVSVRRRASKTENESNVYTILDPSPGPRWNREQKRTRIPRRAPRTKRSETPPKRSEHPPKVSESLAIDSGSFGTERSEHPPEVSERPTPSVPNAPKKTQEKKIHEEDPFFVRNEISDGARIEERATEDQVIRLSDLHRKAFDQSVDSFADHVEEWKALTQVEARKVIAGYYQRVKRANRKTRAAEFDR